MAVWALTSAGSLQDRDGKTAVAAAAAASGNSAGLALLIEAGASLEVCTSLSLVSLHSLLVLRSLLMWAWAGGCGQERPDCAASCGVCRGRGGALGNATKP